MDWCVDTRVAGSTAVIEDELHTHLSRHASEPAVVELARPLIHRALDAATPGPVWLSLDWEEREGHLRGRTIAEASLPGVTIGPGVTRALDEASALTASYGGGPSAFDIALHVARFVERDIDPGPMRGHQFPPESPNHLLGLIAAEIAGGRSVEEAAAGAGATVAALEADQSDLGSDLSGPVQALMRTEERLGADFEVVSESADRAVIRNRRCPFGPTTSSMCRFTSSLVGSLAARVAGEAEVNMLESLAAGDHECRLVVETGPSRHPQVAHRYAWPPEDPPEATEEEQEPRGFQISLSLQLPRDRMSVPITRHLIRSAMQEVHVVAEDGDDVELAVTEACSNVINHAGPGDAYRVSVSIGLSACHIRVVDIGRGFDHKALGRPPMAETDAEHGRGMALMHALVDQVRFESEPERGTVVHLVKKLRFADTATIQQLMSDGDADPGA